MKIPHPKQNQNSLRIVLAILLLISAVAFPWWITAAIGIGALIVSSAEEVIVAGLVIDLLYGVSVSGWFFGAWAMTLLFGSAYFIALIIRFVYRRHFRVGLS